MGGQAHERADQVGAEGDGQAQGATLTQPPVHRTRPGPPVAGVWIPVASGVAEDAKGESIDDLLRSLGATQHQIDTRPARVPLR